MSLVILFYIILIPLLPFFTGIFLSIAPLGGSLAIVSCQLFLGVTLKSIYIAYNNSLLSKPWLQRSYDSFEKAIIFMSLFSFLICIGYWLSSKYEPKLKYGRQIPFSPIVLSRKSSFISLIITVIFFIVICYIYLQQRGLLGLSITDLLINANVSKITRIKGNTDDAFGATFGFTTQFFSVIRIALLILFSNFLLSKKHLIYKISVGVLLLMCLFEVIITGRRNEMLTIAFPLIVMLQMPIKDRIQKHVKHKKKSISNIFKFIYVVPIFVVIFGFITAARAGLEEPLSFKVLLSIKNILDPILKSTYFTDINVLASIMERMNQHDIDFLAGQSYLSVFYGFIPRFLWADKPAISLGIFVKNEIFKLGGTLGGIPPTMPGEAYINFGWIGLLVAVGYGFLLRKFEFILFKKLPHKETSLYLYSLLVFPISWSLMQSSFAIVINGIVSSLLLTYIVWKITIYLRKRQGYTSY